MVRHDAQWTSAVREEAGDFSAYSFPTPPLKPAVVGGERSEPQRNSRTILPECWGSQTNPSLSAFAPTGWRLIASVFLAGSEAYEYALAIYNSAKDAAARNVPGAKVAAQELKARFPGVGREKADPDSVAA
ncbi:MAG: hypothetical protein LBL48_08535 [Azoarcus sp.]|nr:hypothetical protein [Azoarcus sp.]